MVRRHDAPPYRGGAPGFATCGRRGREVPVPAVGGMFLEGTDDERGNLYRADAGGEVESAHRREQAVVRGDVACAGDVVEEDTRRDPVFLVQRRVDAPG